jgi:hypothetical protein
VTEPRSNGVSKSYINKKNYIELIFSHLAVHKIVCEKADLSVKNFQGTSFSDKTLAERVGFAAIHIDSIVWNRKL